jgi:hypothetical protein
MSSTVDQKLCSESGISETTTTSRTRAEFLSQQHLKEVEQESKVKEKFIQDMINSREITEQVLNQEIRFAQQTLGETP